MTTTEHPAPLPACYRLKNASPAAEDALYVANRWESDYLTAWLCRSPYSPAGAPAADLAYIDIAADEYTLEEVRALVDELTSWLHAVESGERYPEIRGYDPAQVVHLTRPTPKAPLCGAVLPADYRMNRTAPVCPNCQDMHAPTRTDQPTNA